MRTLCVPLTGFAIACWRSIVAYSTLILLLFSSPAVYGQNDIVTENFKPGVNISVWDGIFSSGDGSIQGFTTDMSVNKGQRVHFKINIKDGTNKQFTIQVYRLGYYGGNGATLVEDLGTHTGVEQPAPLVDNANGLVDCGNWSETTHWDIPANAVSGIYLAKLTRLSNGGSSHIVFIVRDDAKNTDLLFKTSDATWQAYNNFGPSFYGPSDPGSPLTFGYSRANKVSYNRPFFTRDARPANFLFNAEFAMLQWLERNGYDVKYVTDVDFDRDATPITPVNHKAILSVGHDEYWSKNQRMRFEAARNSGVHLAFFSGNEVYWKTRWENSIDGSGQTHRTLVCYKEGLTEDMGEVTCGSMNCDPLPGTWTGLWRFGGEKDAGMPENMLSGQMSWIERTIPLKVPSHYKNLRFWKNTSVNTLGDGQTAVLGTQILGYEFDFEQEKFRDLYPKGRILMSKTTYVGDGNCCGFDEVEDRFGTMDLPLGKNYTHHLSLYRHSSGALVFAAGTINWAWGLEETHDVTQAPVVPEIQQATINVLADMGAQPGSLQPGMVPGIMSTDFTAPTINIISPVEGTQVGLGKVITITGTATDADGVTAGVEVSVDGGITWKTAQVTSTLNNTVSWTYTFSLSVIGNFPILIRGFDDSGNLGEAGPAFPGSVLTLVGTCPCSVFSPSDAVQSTPRDDDPTPLTVGMKFRTSVDGFILGARFYKDPENTGLHVAKLYSSGGTLLASATYTNETASGWQQISFNAPVPVTANTTYVIAYYSTEGNYSLSAQSFTNGITRGPIRALSNAESGGNGVYAYGDVFPAGSYMSGNYLVDAIFNTTTQCAFTPELTALNPVCAGEPISLRLSGVSGTGPYSLLLNGIRVDNINANETFTAAHLVANPATLINVNIWPSGSGGTASSVTESREIGLRFRSNTTGYVNAIRFFKSAESGTGTFSVRLYDMENPGSPIGFGSVTFNGPDQSGWQVATLNMPVLITANKTYLASYVAPNGRYTESPGALSVAYTNGPLTAIANTSLEPNGLYKTGSGTEAPSMEDYPGAAINYWVDVVFTAVNQVRFTQIVDKWGVTCFSTAPNLSTLNLQPVNCAFLPVTLSDFRISTQADDVTLHWTTASENNNRGFEIQRSNNGTQWTAIGFVNGAVNSQVQRTYQYQDKDLKEGRYFFRLKQVDLDGKFTHSKILNAVINTGKAGFTLGQNYPNPTHGNTTITYTIPFRSHVQIALYDMQGRLVRQIVNESREPGYYTADLDTKGLGKGVYHYKMKAGEFQEVKRLLVN